MRTTLADQLNKHLKTVFPAWIPSPELTDRMRWKNAQTFKYYTSQTVGRALRSLENGELGESKIAVKKDPKSKSVTYKWIPHEMRVRYIPTSIRKNEKLFKDRQ